LAQATVAQLDEAAIDLGQTYEERV
jgi:hypothetical protein